MKFKDHFSQRAALYAVYRPHYPDSLFTYLATLTDQHELALDCGTGNGQAAVALANHFARVVATDPSSAQLANATPRANVEYRVAASDRSGLAPGSVDLVTAAQALHWFNAPAFFAEAKRVVKRSGAVAVWGYGDPILDTDSLQSLLHNFNRVKLEPYWFAERQILLDGYRAIEFPLAELTPPKFELHARWTLEELTGYLRTWSATANYVERNNVDPVSDLERALATEWGDAQSRRDIRWPLHLRVGRLPQ
ncbi:MAG TPA: class I SAM-dependent methyltransferase [Gemmatimonadaceae bacterium]|nr:class I SAM-dependent methyltransferase [Gemmatimonadaceae bacterium]